VSGKKPVREDKSIALKTVRGRIFPKGNGRKKKERNTPALEEITGQKKRKLYGK